MCAQKSINHGFNIHHFFLLPIFNLTEEHILWAQRSVNGKSSRSNIFFSYFKIVQISISHMILLKFYIFSISTKLLQRPTSLSYGSYFLCPEIILWIDFLHLNLIIFFLKSWILKTIFCERIDLSSFEFYHILCAKKSYYELIVFIWLW